MNFKSIHIKYKFLIQMLIFVIYILVISGTAWLMNKRLCEYQKTSSNVDHMQEQIIGLQATYLSFQNLTDANNRFYFDGENDETHMFDIQSLALRDAINKLSDKSRIQRKLDKGDGKDSLLSALENFITDFEQERLVLRSLGTQNSGNILTVSEISSSIGNTLSELSLPNLLTLFSRMKNKESEYLFAGNRLAYDDIIRICDEIAYDTGIYAIDMMLADDLSTKLEDYKTELEQTQALKTRLGSEEEETSLRGATKLSYNHMLSSYQKFRSSWLIEMKKGLRLVRIIGISFIILISLVFVFILFLFSRKIHLSLNESIQYSYLIAKGKLNNKSLPKVGAADFIELNSNLNTINESLLDKKKFVDNLLKQKFQTDITLQGKNDTFGKTLIALKENMRKARDEQLKYHEENRVRRYQNEGIAKFSDILRSNSDNLERLADIFIKEIVRYLEAIQGGLFLLDDEEDEILHLRAAFAYNRKKYLEKQIKKGESLVGTCALEKKTIYLTELPEDYIEITSGLGDAPPNHLLILPVMHEEILIGVLEIASLKAFDENQIELGETISESLASSIINARANSRTAELLEKSQQQAAEMAEQEEEMRQNMEELKATQEESARREEDLEGILNAINQSFYVLEYDIDGSIIKVNERLLYLLNKHVDQVIGKSHTDIFGKKSKVDAPLFASVAEGKTIELTEKVQINKKALEIKNSFSPVKSKDGNIMRILNIMNLNS